VTHKCLADVYHIVFTVLFWETVLIFFVTCFFVIFYPLPLRDFPHKGKKKENWVYLEFCWAWDIYANDGLKTFQKSKSQALKNNLVKFKTTSYGASIKKQTINPLPDSNIAVYCDTLRCTQWILQHLWDINRLFCVWTKPDFSRVQR